MNCAIAWDEHGAGQPFPGCCDMCHEDYDIDGFMGCTIELKNGEEVDCCCWVANHIKLAAANTTLVAKEDEE